MCERAWRWLQPRESEVELLRRQVALLKEQVRSAEAAAPKAPPPAPAGPRAGLARRQELGAVAEETAEAASPGGRSSTG